MTTMYGTKSNRTLLPFGRWVSVCVRAVLVVRGFQKKGPIEEERGNKEREREKERVTRENKSEKYRIQLPICTYSLASMPNPMRASYYPFHAITPEHPASF